MRHLSRPRAVALALAGLLLWGTPLWGQVQVGSETQLSLNGSISAGYSGSMNNEGTDSHGLDFGGVGNISGSYHSAQFLSFDVAPFFNQSRNNSNYQSITDASGVTANASIFSGSEFPGYINFSKLYNSESSFSVPGTANYVTNGNGQTFGIGWAANLKNLPVFSFGYQQGSSDYSLYGTEQDSLSDFHSLYGNASYNVAGFHLSGGIRYSNSSAEFPEIVAGTSEKTSSDSTTYTFNMGRGIPLSGSTWFNFSRVTADFNGLGLSNSESTDVFTGGVSLRPVVKLTTQFGMDYNDNLAGSILQTVNAAGAIVPVSFPGEPSHSWGMYGSAQYAVISGLYVGGETEYRQQLFQGESYDSTAFDGTAHYGHDLLGGQLSANATVSHSSYSGTSGVSTLGLLTSVIYTRQFGPWGVSGSFGYSRNQQTILIGYTSSGYNYSGTASRRIGRLNWNGSASGAKSLMSEMQGTTNVAQGYSTGLAGRWLGASGSYSKSSGSGLLTPTGITTLPPGVPPTLVTAILYGGRTYSAGVGSSPIRGLNFTGSYVNSRSNTANGPLASNNRTEQAYVHLTYRFRKVYFNAGYSRLLQGFSASTVPPSLVSSYYFGVSRWFKVF